MPCLNPAPHIREKKSPAPASVDFNMANVSCQSHFLQSDLQPSTHAVLNGPCIEYLLNCCVIRLADSSVNLCRHASSLVQCVPDTICLLWRRGRVGRSNIFCLKHYHSVIDATLRDQLLMRSCSAIRPPSSTRIKSACVIVLNRCAITNAVRPCSNRFRLF